MIVVNVSIEKYMYKKNIIEFSSTFEVSETSRLP